MFAIGFILVILGALLVRIYKTPRGAPQRWPVALGTGFGLVILGALLMGCSMVVKLWQVMP